MNAVAESSGTKVATKPGRVKKRAPFNSFQRCRFGVQKINDENNAQWELPQYSPGCRKMSTFEKRILKLKVSQRNPQINTVFFRKIASKRAEKHENHRSNLEYLELYLIQYCN
jgi:hypothetical protein